MALDPEETEHVREWIRRHHGGPLTCLVCAAATWDSWEIDLFRPLEFDDRVASHLLPFVNRYAPIVEIRCRTCGYLLTIDAMTIGVRGPSHLYPKESAPPAADAQ